MPSVRPYTRPWAPLPRPDAAVFWGASAACHHGSQWGLTLNRFSTGRTPSSSRSHLLASPDPDIDIKSLRNTLQSVRETNRASHVVRKVDQAGHSTRLLKKPQFRYVKAETTADAQPHQRQFFEHLSQHVQEKKRKRVVKRVATPSVALAPAHGRGEFEEEIGTSHELTSFWRPNDGEQTIPTRFRLPWLSHLSEQQTWTSAVDRLSSEIRAFEQYVAPSKEEQLVTEAAIQDLIQAIKYADENLDVDVIGSRATGTADPLSDLDVNVSRPRTPASLGSNKLPVEILGLLERAFRGTHGKIKLGFRPVEVVYNLKTARVPILLCRHKLSGLPIQIQCTPRTYDSTEYVKAFLREYPTLRGLFKVLKQLLLMRGLTAGSHGGLTSYPLLNMIVAALKFSEGKIHPLDAGKQLLFFLDMYSEIDFSSQGISTRPLQYFPKQGGRKRKLPVALTQDAALSELFPQELAGQRKLGIYRGKSAYLMTLQDPANPSNDVGRSAYMIKDVQATLIIIRGKLKEALAEWDQYCLNSDAGPAPSRPQALLEPCIGADYRIYEQERGDLKALGRQFLDSRKKN